MLLRRLRLRSFRHIADADIALLPGITVITGANGAGKSTLLEGIVWTLYGAKAARRSEQSLHPDHDRDAVVEAALEIEQNGVTLHAERSLRRAAGVSAARIHTDLILPSRDLFMRACFTGRRELQNLAHLAPAERMSVLARLLGGGPRAPRLRPRGIVATALRSLEEELESTNRRMSALVTAPDLLAQYGVELERARSELADVEAHAARVHDEWAQKKQDVQTRLDAYRRRCDELKRQIDRLGAAGARGACPTCDQSLGSGIERVIGRLDDEFYVTTQDVKWLVQRLAQLERRPPDVAEADGKRDRMRALVADRTERVARCEQAVQELWAVAQEQQNTQDRLETLREQMPASPAASDIAAVVERAGAIVAAITHDYEGVELTSDGRVYGMAAGARTTLVSGADEDVIALALRLAAARIAGEREGVTTLLLLDEPFGAMDAVRRAALFGALRAFTPPALQIIITTQDATLGTLADHVITMPLQPLPQQIPLQPTS